MPRTLLLGMGNPVLRDDAVGVRLAAQIGARLGSRPELDVIEECSVGGLNLLDVVEGYDRLIVLDSIKAGGPPGHWYRFDATALKETMNLRNVHDTNFATALELGRRLGRQVPKDEAVHVFAVEVVDNQTFDERMSEPLERAFAEVLAEIGEEIDLLLSA